MSGCMLVCDAVHSAQDHDAITAQAGSSRPMLVANKPCAWWLQDGLLHQRRFAPFEV